MLPYTVFTLRSLLRLSPTISYSDESSLRRSLTALRTRLGLSRRRISGQ
jgi:hypothetical protein